jgi:type I restriction enzyme R subunit
MKTEQQIENELLKKLESMNYSFLKLNHDSDLKNNLKVQLEKINKTQFSDFEFESIFRELTKTNNLLDKHELIINQKISFKNDKNENQYIDIFNKEFCKNIFQVTHQLSRQKNRYDVIILINGFPIIQIELKNNNVELKSAFEQIKRYKKQSLDSGLTAFLKIFIVSNSVDTFYFANNNKLNENLFEWRNKDNKKLSNLNDFVEDFLEIKTISKIINSITLVKDVFYILRYYQFYAIEAIDEKIKTNNGNGYIWHTTGSGKTLTSFIAAKKISKSYKTIFAVDRKDLDMQTIQEFNKFGGDLDPVKNSYDLVNMLLDDNVKLIVTTIQKLNIAIQKNSEKLNKIRNEKIVFIFDECHRSQFGDSHKRINNFFVNNQMIGFTGTPIFVENANGKRTTKDLFGNCLHKYVITNAIAQRNVLRFLIEYIGKYTKKETDTFDLDIEIEADLNNKELMSSESRLNKIVDHILLNYNLKTMNKKYNSIFAVSDIDTLIKYYDIFKDKKHNLKIAAIFSASDNDEAFDEDEYFDNKNITNKDKLAECINDYNKMFDKSLSINELDDYHKTITNDFKNNKIDVLLVVNMFLTGFDSKNLNTLYLDKNLQHHGLIQAFSRTNRVSDQNKTHGNIVSYRNIKKQTDDAIALFSDENAKEIIFLEPFYVAKQNFDKSYNELIEFSLEYKIEENQDVFSYIDNIISEEEKRNFVVKCKKMLKDLRTLGYYQEFKNNSIDMDIINGFKSKYSLIHQETERNIQKVSVLNEVDFEIEILGKDNINVDYIFKLLNDLKNKNQKDKEESTKEIHKQLNQHNLTTTKRKLINKFIEKVNQENIQENFEDYCEQERKAKIEQIKNDYGFTEKDFNKFMSSLEKYKFDKKQPTFNNFDFYFIENATGTGIEKLKKQLNLRTEIAALIVELSEFC